MARCPECGEKLTLPASLDRWDRFYCDSCKAELEVLNLKPLELEAVYDSGGDGLLDELDEDLEDAEDLEELDDQEWDEDNGDADDGDDEAEEERDW